MTDEPNRPVPGDPLSGGGDPEPEPERDAFGNPIPGGGAASRPAEPGTPGIPWDRGAGPEPPPPGMSPAAPPAPTPPPPSAPPPAPPVADQPGPWPAPPTPPGYGHPPPAAPPGYGAPPAYPAPVAPGPPLALRGLVLADWGTRAGATLMDGLLVSVPIILGIVVVIAGSEVIGGLILLLSFVFALLYAPLTMMRSGPRNGQTLGKQMLGIRVVRQTGESFGFGYALLREFVVKGLLIGTVGGFFLSIPTLLDYLWPLWDEQNRALHDMVAATRVVRA